jgi:uncharacterized damage-inducible protein DinB
MKTMAEFLGHYRRQRRWTRALVAAVPAEHFDWTPGAGAFSCGDLVRHLMQAEIFWCRLLVGAAEGKALDPFGLEGSAEERMQGLRGRNLDSSHAEKYGRTSQECLALWSEIEERTCRDLESLPDNALHDVQAAHPVTLLRAPLWQMLLIMVEHEAHHRGQLSAYLKMIGVEQPAAIIGT